MTRLVIHMGAHRCGSTGIQRLITANRNVLNAEGWRFLSRGNLQEQSDFAAFNQLHRTRWFDLIGQRRLGQLAGLIAQHEKLLLSEENLCGRMPGASRFHFYSGKKRLMACLARLQRIAPIDLRLVLMVRRQDRLVESLYAFRVMRGEQRSFADFASRFRPARLDWNRFVMRAERHKLSGHLHIGTVEGLGVPLVNDLFNLSTTGELSGNASLSGIQLHLWQALQGSGIDLRPLVNMRHMATWLREIDGLPEADQLGDHLEAGGLDFSAGLPALALEKASSNATVPTRFSEDERQIFLEPLMAANRIFLDRSQVRADDMVRQRWLSP